MPRSLLILPLLFLAQSLTAEDFFVPDGLKVSSALAPGLVKHPIMATLDDRGRLFVAENAGVNLDKEALLKELPNSVKMLEDTNGDGIFDKATVFADKLTFPQGALWVYDSLYVMSPPSLWRFADEDGDGRAEVREELVTGFDFTGNAADVHGPFLHPNGRLYWCHGRKGFAIPDNDTGEIMEQGKGARIWSSQLSGGEVESFAGGGMDNPVEIDFTDEGEIIGTVNLFYGRPRGDTLTHWVHGGAYPRFDQGLVLEEFRKTGDLLPPVHNFGHVAVSGMARYRSGALNPDWSDGWLVTHFNTSDLTLTKLLPKGAGFESAETQSIFRILKPDAHLTDVLEDRNGDLLVIDTGGWFRIGCPTSQIAKPEIAGDIYRLSKDGGDPYVAPVYPDWPRLTSEQVSEYLGATEDWLQERAITELAVRGEPAVPELRRILQSGSAPAAARKNAVWTLARMKFSETADLIYEALTDIDSGVRQAACNAISVTRIWQIVAANDPGEREIEIERNQTISGALAGIVRGDDPSVARAAAAALGRMGEHRAIGAILGRLGRASDDRFLEHSLVYALIEIDDFATTREGLSSTDPGLLSGTLRALDQMASSNLDFLSVMPFLEANDATLRKTALAVAARHHEWDAALANYYFDWSGEIEETRRTILTTLVPAFSDSPPTLDYLSNLLTSADPMQQRLGLELVSLSTDMTFQEAWSPAFEAALSADSDDLLLIGIQALQACRSEPFTPVLQSLCGNTDRSYTIRLEAAEALGAQNGTIPPASFDLIERVLSEPTESEIRAKALSLLSHSPLSAEQRDRIIPALKNFSPVEWGSFPDLFRKIDSSGQASLLASALTESPALANLEATKIKALFDAFPEARTLIGAKLEEIETEKSSRGAKIETLLQSMPEADAEAGEKVFLSGKGACLACHRVGNVGGQIGPDLSSIGRIRTARDLYESILFPSESIARDFDTFEVKRKSQDSVTHIGLIQSQTEKGIELIGLSGQKQLIPHDEIASISRIPVSLMPMGLDQTLTPEELRDLAAFLLEQR